MPTQCLPTRSPCRLPLPIKAVVTISFDRDSTVEFAFNVPNSAVTALLCTAFLQLTLEASLHPARLPSHIRGGRSLLRAGGGLSFFSGPQSSACGNRTDTQYHRDMRPQSGHLWFKSFSFLGEETVPHELQDT